MFMFSMPPATTTSASPARISAAASMIDFMPLPQTRLIVVALVVTGRPALRAAWRAGAWPTPAWMTWPIRTSSMRRVLGQLRALDRGPDGDAAELDGRRVHEGATELADRRARGAHEVDLPVGLVVDGHVRSLVRRP